MSFDAEPAAGAATKWRVNCRGDRFLRSSWFICCGSSGPCGSLVPIGRRHHCLGESVGVELPVGASSKILTATSSITGVEPVSPERAHVCRNARFIFRRESAPWSAAHSCVREGLYSERSSSLRGWPLVASLKEYNHAKAAVVLHPDF
jgi:hypothetical protein